MLINRVRQALSHRMMFYTPMLTNRFVGNVSAQPQATLQCSSLNETVSRWRQLHTSSTLLNKKNTSTSFNIQDEDDFDSQVIHSKTPVIVDFHAEWCGPCKFLGPRLENEVDKHSGNVLLAKVDVDDLGLVAMRYKVMAVPSVMLFVGGEVVDKFEGNVDDDLLTNFVNKAVK